MSDYATKCRELARRVADSMDDTKLTEYVVDCLASEYRHISGAYEDDLEQYPEPELEPEVDKK